MRKGLLYLLPLLLLLAGCRPMVHTQPQSPVVTQIMVEGEYEQTPIYRHYQSSDKMRQILLYIRALRPRHNANTDPELLDTPRICITLTYRDGAVKQYHLRGRRFFREGEDTWKKVESEQADKLYQLIWDLESD